MKADLADIAQLISEGDNFLVITHANPDGDAIGSIFALANLLRENGKKADALLSAPLPCNYMDLAPREFKTSITEEDLQAYSLCLCVDVSIPERADLGPDLTIDSLKIPLINIDHHPDNKLFGTKNLVNPNSAATAEIIFFLAKKIPSWKISPETATLLLLGIIMDTGCYKFDNASPEAMNASAELLELKADHHKIIKYMFFSKQEAYLRLTADITLNHLKTACDGRYAWFYLDDSLLASYNVEMKDTEGLIEIARMIDTVEIAAVIYKKDKDFKISLRSKCPDCSVGKIARKFNGGGHELAAGAIIKASNIQEAENILLESVKQELKS